MINEALLLILNAVAFLALAVFYVCTAVFAFWVFALIFAFVRWFLGGRQP